MSGSYGFDAFRRRSWGFNIVPDISTPFPTEDAVFTSGFDARGSWVSTFGDPNVALSGITAVWTGYAIHRLVGTGIVGTVAYKAMYTAQGIHHWLNRVFAPPGVIPVMPSLSTFRGFHIYESPTFSITDTYSLHSGWSDTRSYPNFTCNWLTSTTLVATVSPHVQKEFGDNAETGVRSSYPGFHPNYGAVHGAFLFTPEPVGGSSYLMVLITLASPITLVGTSNGGLLSLVDYVANLKVVNT